MPLTQLTNKSAEVVSYPFRMHANETRGRDKQSEVPCRHSLGLLNCGCDVSHKEGRAVKLTKLI